MQTTITRLFKQKGMSKRVENFFTNPLPTGKAKLEIPPPRGVTPGLIGHAYDYYIKCHAVRLRGKKLNEIESLLGVRAARSRFELAKGELANSFIAALTAVEDYVKGKSVEPYELSKSLLLIGKLEIESRVGDAVGSYEILDVDIAEMMRLVEASQVTWLSNGDSTLAPNFSYRGSKGTLEADGDLIVGDCLYEIKTTKLVPGKPVVRQLAAYYVLNGLKRKPYKIKEVGIYNVRHRLHAHFPANEVVSHSQQQAFREFFLNRFGSH